jgi:hypothetical protein
VVRLRERLGFGVGVEVAVFVSKGPNTARFQDRVLGEEMRR